MNHRHRESVALCCAKTPDNLSCQLSPFQREVYSDILARNHAAFNQGTHVTQRTNLMNILKELQKVCNHPFLFPAAEKDAFKVARKSGLSKKIAAAASSKLKNAQARAESNAPPDPDADAGP